MIKSTSTVEVTSPSNPRPSPQDAKAHHPTKGSKSFNNPWSSFAPMPGAMKFIGASICGEIRPKTIPKNVPELIGVATPSWETGDKNKVKATWFGHACFYVELPCNENQERGLRVLFDPVFSDRCSPVSFAGPQRLVKAPTTVDGLPEIDIVCISHNHYDHLDVATVNALNKRFGLSIHFFIPIGLASFFESSKISNFTELDWWEERVIRKNDLEGRFGYLPAQHFSNRGLFDQGHSLWGSYSIESTSHPDKKVWFAGDTARRSIPREIEINLPKSQPELDKLPVCPAHKQIGELRGPFAFAMIPVGAYLPRYLMSGVHVDPGEAISIFHEVRAERAAAMHWGTWVLSAEEVMAPRDELVRLCKEQGVQGFEAWKIGERTEI